MAGSLVVNEIYVSLQGESTLSGLPCVFIRLTACNLRCSYCDTAYAFTQGERRGIPEVLAEVRRLAKPFGGREGSARLPLVEVTGGEPLLQEGVHELMTALADDGFTVLIETSGAHDISRVDERVRRIMDLKCPSSGEVDRNCWANLEHLKARDEIKFVVGTKEDVAWMTEQIRSRQLDAICPLLVSWVEPLSEDQRDPSLKAVPEGQTPISRQDLAEHIVQAALPVRFQVQMHKVIWDPSERGV